MQVAPEVGRQADPPSQRTMYDSSYGGTKRESLNEAGEVKERKWFFSAAGNPHREYDLLHPETKISAAASVPDALHTSKIKFFDYNLYAMKKSVSSAMLDVALLMANASQLKTLVTQKDENDFYIPLVVLISISIAMQLIIGAALVVLSRININEPHHSRQAFADALNTCVVIAVFVLVIVNIFVSAFGISSTTRLVYRDPPTPPAYTGGNST